MDVRSDPFGQTGLDTGQLRANNAVAQRGFTASEFESRAARAQRAMAEVGMDALLLTTEPEIRYFTGFLTQFWQSPTRPLFLIVPSQGKPVAVIPGVVSSLMETTWIEDIRTWDSPQPQDEGVSLLADTLRSIVGNARGKIGVPMGPETTLRMPLKDYFLLQESLPNFTFRDATDVVKGLRMIKSEAEIAKVAQICRIASDAFDTVPKIVAEGQLLHEAFKAFKIELLKCGADDVPYLAGDSLPGGYDSVISPPGSRPIAAGDLLMMDTGATCEGYFCDFDRNYSIGAADDDARRGYDTLFRATDAAFSIARPGATCSDLFLAMQKTIADDGYSSGNAGRMGHGLGMQLTEWPSHTALDTTVLVPGMVLTLEPGLFMGPGRGMIHEENLVIREDGAEYLSRRAPRELPEIA